MRVVYRVADGEHVTITGAERVTGWVRDVLNPNVWTVTVPNTLFGAFNPFARTVFGDWVVDPSSHAATLRRTAQGDARLAEAEAEARTQADDDAGASTVDAGIAAGILAGYPASPACHLGDVYLDGKSLYEVFSPIEVLDPSPRVTSHDHGSGLDAPIADREGSTHVWYAEVDGDADTGSTTIWANFQGADPNERLAEISVRETVFYPTRPQINYITVRGFELAQAATPWAPPTADQIGLIGAHWSRGWIIENNDIHDAKCSAVSLGKEGSTGDNDCTVTRRKSGYQYQMEAVFKALRFGWRKGVVGGHVVRSNTIHDCGQNGVVGHMGCAFSVIERNHIYNIATKHEFWGHEIGGIKLHAAVDTVIRANNIHDCTLGTWLDWQTQGTHIDRNVYWNNTRDLMVEVSHGPYTVSNNVFASPLALDVFSDGGAYVNNLIAGQTRLIQVLDRSTPYHFPHTTEVAGSMFVYGGDDRFLNNLFVRPAGAPPENDDQHDWCFVGHGTRVYNVRALNCGMRGVGEQGEIPSTLEEYERLASRTVTGDEEQFREVPQPVYARDNTYLGGARALLGERGALASEAEVAVTVRGDGDAVSLAVGTSDAGADGVTFGSGSIVRTADLGTPRVVEARFENPDGSPFSFDADIVGDPRGERSSRGPVAALEPGRPVVVWRR
ncbi:right-handed parallel beta-helix repeat-containing protein [Bifidobacterium eulemuris]|nr:right-handed parallel beta-helix repeat-containing protein [Bifidobacterium eulemuris]